MSHFYVPVLYGARKGGARTKQTAKRKAAPNGISYTAKMHDGTNEWKQTVLAQNENEVAAVMWEKLKTICTEDGLVYSIVVERSPPGILSNKHLYRADCHFLQRAGNLRLLNGMEIDSDDLHDLIVRMSIDEKHIIIE